MPTTDLALWLKERRGRHGLTQEALAELASVAPHTITAYETGSRRPSFGTLAKLAEALKLSAPERVELQRLAGHTPLAAQHSAPVSWTVAPLGLMIGRAAELAALAALLARPAVRLVSLTGLPGVGKTRLALAAADAVREAFPDGVVRVNLAHSATPEQALLTIAAAFGLTTRTDLGPEEALVAQLQALRTLLVLDHSEQASFSAQCELLLSECSKLTILVVSRAPLRLPFEHRFPLAPLNTQASIGSDAISSAAALFVERARAVKPSFVLDAANRADVEAICELLDGLPLGIELVAACVSLLSPREIARRLVGHLPLPNANHHDATFDVVLRDAIRRVVELLAPDQQALFRRMGAFSANCSLEALAVASGWSGPGAERRLLASIEGLVQHSLVQVHEDEHGEPHFALLRTIGAVASEELLRSGEAPALYQRLAAFYQARATSEVARLHGPLRQQALARLDADHANMLAVLRHALGAGDDQTAARLAGVVGEFWLMRGFWHEGRELLEQLLARPEQLSRSQLTLLLRHAGVLARRVGAYEQAREHFAACLAQYRADDDRAGSAYVLNLLGLIAAHQGDYATARKRYDESLAFWLALGNMRNVAAVKVNLASLAAIQSDYRQALALCDEALYLHQTHNNLRGVSRVLCNKGVVALYQNSYGEAYEYFVAAIANTNRNSDPAFFALLMSNIGFTLLFTGELAQADEHFRQSLYISRRLGGQRDIAYGLEGLAGLAVSEDRPADALRLFGAATLLRERIGAAAPAVEQALHTRFIAQAREQCGPMRSETAWAMGRSQPLQQVIGEALAR